MDCIKGLYRDYVGIVYMRPGLKYGLFSPRNLGEDSHFDDYFSGVGSTTN